MKSSWDVKRGARLRGARMRVRARACVYSVYARSRGSGEKREGKFPLARLSCSPEIHPHRVAPSSTATAAGPQRHCSPLLRRSALRSARADLPSKCEASVRCLLYVLSERERVLNKRAVYRQSLTYLDDDVVVVVIVTEQIIPGRRHAAQYRC